MIVAAQQGLLAGEYKVLTQNVLINNQTHKLYKSSNFKSWAAISSIDMLQSLKVATLTQYNPIFFVIKEAQSILCRCESSMKQLDQIFSQTIINHFKQEAIAICQCITQGQNSYYKVSQSKILKVLEKRFQTLVEKLSLSKIHLSTSKLQKQGDTTPIKIFAIDIMRQDVGLDLMDKLINMVGINIVASKSVFLDQYKEQEQNQHKSYNNIKKISSATKISMKDEKLKKEAKSSMSLNSFFTKKPVSQAETQSQTQPPIMQQQKNPS